MTDPRRFQLDELTIRPGTYFNPQTEVLIVVDDSPEVDHEIFATEEFEGTDWVLISEESPLDEDKRDELVEHFRVTYQPGSDLATAGEEEDVDEDDELEADDLELDREYLARAVGLRHLRNYRAQGSVSGRVFCKAPCIHDPGPA